MFITTTKYKIRPCHQKRFHEEISKTRQDILKNLEKHGFLVYQPSNNCHLSNGHFWRGGIQEIHDFQGFWSLS